MEQQREALLRKYAAQLSDRIDELKAKRRPKPPPVESEGFRQFADSLPGVVWITGADGIPTFHSRQWHERFGRGANYLEILHPDDRQRVLDAWDASLASGQTYCQVARFLTLDEGYVPLLTHAHPLRGPDGSIASWVGSSAELPSSCAPELRIVA